jgi:hypothetical protein
MTQNKKLPSRDEGSFGSIHRVHHHLPSTNIPHYSIFNAD